MIFVQTTCYYHDWWNHIRRAGKKKLRKYEQFFLCHKFIAYIICGWQSVPFLHLVYSYHLWTTRSFMFFLGLFMLMFSKLNPMLPEAVLFELWINEPPPNEQNIDIYWRDFWTVFTFYRFKSMLISVSFFSRLQQGTR